MQPLTSNLRGRARGANAPLHAICACAAILSACGPDAPKPAARQNKIDFKPTASQGSDTAAPKPAASNDGGGGGGGGGGGSGSQPALPTADTAAKRTADSVRLQRAFDDSVRRATARAAKAYSDSVTKAAADAARLSKAFDDSVKKAVAEAARIAAACKPNARGVVSSACPADKRPVVPTGTTGRGGGPVPPAGATRTVVFRTNVPDAHVRLRTPSGQTIEPTKTEPITFTVPAGAYAWEVSAAGYLSEHSERNAVDVGARGADTVVLRLTPAGERARILSEANAAYTAGQCIQAIEKYVKIERPGEIGSNIGREWLESQAKLAQCQRKQRLFGDAIDTYKGVLEAEAFQWRAKYELGTTYCDMKNFTAGQRELHELDGPYLNRLAQDHRRSVQAMARFGIATCQAAEYREAGDSHTEMLGPAVKSYDDFIYAAESLLEAGVPDDVKQLITDSLKEAKTKRNSLSKA